MKGFEDLTREDVRRMPISEIHRRGFETYGFKGWMLFVLQAQAPRLALLLLGLIACGLHSLYKWVTQ